MGLRLVLIGVVLAGLAYTGLWFQMADGARERLDAAVDAAGGTDLRIDFAAAETRGFPDRIGMLVEDLILASATAPLRLRASKLTLAARPWAPDHVLGEGEALRLQLGNLTIEAPTPRMSWIQRSESFDLDVDFGAVTLLAGSRAAPAGRAAGMQAHLRFPRGDGDGTGDLFAPQRAHIAVSATELSLENDMEAVESVSGEGVLHGALTPPLDRAALAAWRDQGGTLDIESLELAWGDLEATGEGSLSLDEAFRPLGAVTVTVNSPAALLDKLVEAGLVDTDLARRLRPALSALGQGSGGGKPISLPLTLQDGRVLLSGIPIARLQPVIGR